MMPAATRSRRVNRALIGLALVGAVVFLRHYVGIIALAILSATLVAPLHARLVSRPRTRRYATAIGVTVVVLAIVLPLIGVLLLSAYQAQVALNDLREAHFLEQGLRPLEAVVARFNEAVAQTPLAGQAQVSQEELVRSAQEWGKQLASALLAFLTSTTGNLITLFIDAFTYLILLAGFLKYRDQVMRAILNISPLQDHITREYLVRSRAMGVSMVKGTLAIAVVAGLVSAIAFWIVGIPYPAFWFVFLTLMSIIPLGAGVAVIPAAIIFLITGQWWQGIFLLAVQIIVLNNTDNVLRPILAPKGTGTLPSALLLLSIFAGVNTFGMMGVVYGPVIMILITTAVEMFMRYADSGIPVKPRAILRD